MACAKLNAASSQWIGQQSFTQRQGSSSASTRFATRRVSFPIRAKAYSEELVQTAGLVPLPGSNNESWCQGLDGLASRSAEYYKQGARFAKWRTVVSIPCGPSALAVKEAAWGLARYAAISQILLDGDHPIERTLEVAEKVWSEVFFYLAENNVLFEGILLKPSMVTPGAEHKERASPETIAKYTLTMLKGDCVC
ncbi:fructose-bisphosphate aldolase 3 [Quercus suber]|uniref:Fructose-bisphosphate aldolase n=1 Tax=Quercus suber TaxID=58331 RepID=A0AAW0LN88_QUESU